MDSNSKNKKDFSEDEEKLDPSTPAVEEDELAESDEESPLFDEDDRL